MTTNNSQDEPKAECYKDAYTAVQELAQVARCGEKPDSRDIEPIVLVHGSVIPPVGPMQGKRMDHAWIEVSEKRVVLELSAGNQKRYSQDQWITDCQPITEARYSPEEAFDHGKRLGHYGPWHKDK